MNKLKNNPEIVKLVFKLYDGRFVEIQTAKPFLVSIVNGINVNDDEKISPIFAE